MLAENTENGLVQDEQIEFDYYLQFEWPEHIETALRRMLFIAFVETAELEAPLHRHTHLLRWLIATYPESPEAALDYLCQFNDSKLLVRVAENPSTSAATLQVLSRHESSEVKIAVADNRKTPLPVLLRFLASDDLDLRYSMAENSALPSKFLEELAKDENVYISCCAKKTYMKRSPGTIQQFPVRQLQEQRKTS